jgi:hypothetical protein
LPTVEMSIHDGPVEALVSRLRGQFDVAPEEIRRLACELFTRFADSRVQAFVPVLVEKQVRERLRHRRSAPA